MNPCLVDLFDDSVASTKLVTKLPVAFEMAGLELPGNPAVGFLREHAITGFLKNHFDSDRVIVPEAGNKRGFDVTVCGCELSIKTVTKDGGVKILWTVDTDKVDEEIGERYSPSCDIFLTRIYWESYKESIFYIPVESQKDIFCDLGRDNYLKSAIGTNHRGIEISKLAMEKLQTHKRTKKLSVNWRRSGLDHTPYRRWEDFWKEE